MKKVLLFITVIGCSNWANDRSDCFDGCTTDKRSPKPLMCSSIETPDEIIISCDNGSQSVIVRPKDGRPGDKGATGTSCSVQNEPSGAIITCEDGTIAEVMNGSQGEPGSPGMDGSSCSVSPYTDGAIIQCTDGTSVVVFNGQPGEDGKDVEPGAYTITQLVNPCPLIPGQHREVLLRMANGELIAHYSHGSKQFLTLVGPGSYTLTDGSGCNFEVDSALTVIDQFGNTWEIPE